MHLHLEEIFLIFAQRTLEVMQARVGRPWRWRNTHTKSKLPPNYTAWQGHARNFSLASQDRKAKSQEWVRYLGRGSNPSLQVGESGEGCEFLHWGSGRTPDRLKVFQFPLFSVLRMASPDTIILSVVDYHVAVWGQEPCAPPPCVRSSCWTPIFHGIPMSRLSRPNLMNLFKNILQTSSWLHYLVPPTRDAELLSGLRATSTFLRILNRIKKYRSFMSFALSHYQ